MCEKPTLSFSRADPLRINRGRLSNTTAGRCSCPVMPGPNSHSQFIIEENVLTPRTLLNYSVKENGKHYPSSVEKGFTCALFQLNILLPPLPTSQGLALLVHLVAESRRPLNYPRDFVEWKG